MISKHILLTYSAILTLGSANAVTIVYQDDFNGSTANLQGASPDIGSGTWTTSNNFDRNGDINVTAANSGSATLGFVPSNDLVYTLEASVSLTAGGSGDWVAFGFANGQSTSNGTNFRFLSGNTVEGRAWMYARENTNNPAAQLTGNGNGTGWSGFTNSPSDLDLRIILDTTGGTSNWTATWFAKDSSSGSYTEVRSETALDDEDINSVGFAVSGGGVAANISDFSLTYIPEPSSVVLFGMGALALIRRRRP